MTRQRQAPLKLEFDVVAAGLQFPEGPCVLGEDSLLVVELARRTLTHVDLRAARRSARVNPSEADFFWNHCVEGLSWYGSDTS